MRERQRMTVIGGVAAVVIATTGFGVYTLVGEEEKQATGGTENVSAEGDGKRPEPEPTGPPSEEEVRTTASEFLDAWASGEARKAAALTDAEDAARKALKKFREKAYVTGLEFQAGKPSGTTMPFKVTARVTYEQERKTWSYDSGLKVVRDEETGEPAVHWKPSVLHPKLEKGQSIVTGEAGDPPLKAVGRNGVELTTKEYPSLAPLLKDWRERYAEEAGGTGAIKTHIVDSEGENTGTSFLKFAEPEPGTLRTTIDSAVQNAAEAAVATKKKSAVVAIKPSTGEILAVANQRPNGFNRALEGSYAPGSTMKVITAAMLMDKGLADPAKPHPCPKYFTHGGFRFHNANYFQIKNGTFAQSFAASCNTAFISQAPKLDDDALTKEAKEVFGIGLTWKVGTTTMDGRVPVQSKDEVQMAASLIGQGAVRMNPLTMASVSATAKSGVFRQPYIVPPEVDGRTLAKAPRRMKPEVAANLREMMHLTAVSGTASEPMAGMTGDFGAKTGTAEVGGQKKPNAWFTAYSGDIAAAALVPRIGHGGEHAGPIVRKVLDSYNG